MQIINANISEQVYVWTPPKTASTRQTTILSKLGFKFYTPVSGVLTSESDFSHTHECVFYNDPSYKLLLTIRNPYEQMVSYLKHSNAQDRFLNKEKGPYGKFKLTEDMNQNKFEHFLTHLIYEKKWCWDCYRFSEVYPEYVIRSENMFEDYSKIPFVTKTEYFTSGELLEDCKIKVNVSKYEDFDFRLLYNQRIADLVYYNFAHIFEMGNYDKNSWKK